MSTATESTFAGYTLSNQQQVDAFCAKHPDGYTVLDGDRGIGLVGAYATEARAAATRAFESDDGSAEAWQTLASKLAVSK